MLRWQPQRVPEQSHFVTKILGISVALHVIACLALFFYQAQGGKLSFTTNRMISKDVIVKVLPFGQKKPASQVTLGTSGAAKSGTQSKSGRATKSVKTAVAAQKSQLSLGKKVAKKAGTLKKEAVKKNKKTKNTKEQVRNKKEKAAALTPKQIEKQVSKPVDTVPEKLPEPVSAVPAEAVPANAVLEQAGLGELSAVADQTASQEIIYVSQEELADIELQRLLTDALVEAWHPPAGIPATVACQALITVTREGGVAEYALTSPSGIMIYDVSVEEGIKALTFPRQLWGKTVELIFKPWADA